MTGALSDDLTAFIREVCDSIEIVEILLLLASDPETMVTAEEVARRLATTAESARLRLERLAARALAHATDGRYRFAPATVRRARLVAELEVAYRSHRMRVIDIVFSDGDPVDDSQKSN